MRPFPSGRFSSSEQNIIIKKYCEENELDFSIPFPEYVYPRCFVQLFNILKFANIGSSIIIFSVFQFFDYSGDIDELVRIFNCKFKTVYFPLEKMGFDLESKTSEFKNQLQLVRSSGSL